MLLGVLLVVLHDVRTSRCQCGVDFSLYPLDFLPAEVLQQQLLEHLSDSSLVHLLGDFVGPYFDAVIVVEVQLRYNVGERVSASLLLGDRKQVPLHLLTDLFFDVGYDLFVDLSLEEGRNCSLDASFIDVPRDILIQKGHMVFLTEVHSFEDFDQHIHPLGVAGFEASRKRNQLREHLFGFLLVKDLIDNVIDCVEVDELLLHLVLVSVLLDDRPVLLDQRFEIISVLALCLFLDEIVELVQGFLVPKHFNKLASVMLVVGASRRKGLHQPKSRLFVVDSHPYDIIRSTAMRLIQADYIILQPLVRMEYEVDNYE